MPCPCHAVPMPCRAHAMPCPYHAVPMPCRAHAVPMLRPCRSPAMPCLSQLIHTVRTCLIHTFHVMPMPCSDHAVLLKATTQHGRRETACGLPARFRLLPATTWSYTKFVIRSIQISDASGQCETKQRLSWTRKRVVSAHCKNRLGAAWARHAMCESAFSVPGKFT